MKKFFLAMVFALTLVLPTFAKAPLSYIQDGAWAFYTDNRFDNEIYRGFLVLNDDEADTSIVYLRVVTNPKKPKTDVHYAVEVLWNDKEPVLGTVYNVQGFTEKSLDDAILVQSALDILNFDLAYQSNKKVINYDTVIDDIWDNDFVQQYHFNKALPCFRFDSINVKGSTADYIKIDRFGLAQNEADIENFFKVTKWALKPGTDKTTYTYDDAKATKVKLSGVTYNLDEKWTHVDASETNLEHYALSKYSVRDASVVVEDISGQLSTKSEDEMIVLANALISFKNETLVPGSIKASYANKTLTFSFVTVDTNNKNLTTIEMYKITNKGKVIELFAFEKCYNDNKEYFDTILQSAK